MSQESSPIGPGDLSLPTCEKGSVETYTVILIDSIAVGEADCVKRWRAGLTIYGVTLAERPAGSTVVGKRRERSDAPREGGGSYGGGSSAGGSYGGGGGSAPRKPAGNSNPGDFEDDIPF